MKRIAPILLPALLPVLQMFLFGPLTLYSGNTGEFDIGFWTLLGRHAWLGGIIAVLLVAIGAMLLEKGRQYHVSVLTGLSLLLWIQSSFLVRNYGQFGSNDADWNAFTWAPWIDGFVWIAVLVASVVFANRIAKIANHICGTLAALLAIVFVVSVVGLKGPPPGSEESVAPDEVMQFSRGRNVVHFVFDELQSTLFAELLADPGYELAELMEGFTVFNNTSGSFPTTIMSMPVIHSGRVFDNATPAREFLRDIYRKESLTTPNVLADSGYAVDLVTPHGWQSAFKHRSFFKLPVPYGVPISKRIEVEASTLRNLVHFRYAPHSVKQWIAREFFSVSGAGDGGEVVAMPEGDENAEGGRWVYARHFAHRDFMKDLVARMNISGTQPTYKFIHTLSTHYPTVYNPDGTPAGGPVPFAWDSVRTQVRATLEEFVGFLRKARQLGIYENMLIVVNSDHGYYKVPDSAKMVDFSNWTRRAEGYPVLNEEAFAQIICAAQPMLAVKLPGATGGVSFSAAPAALGDVPATIADALGIGASFPGKSVFKLEEGADRDRTFAYYSRLMGSNEDYFQGFVRYRISGRVSDPNSWSLSGDRDGSTRVPDTAGSAQLEPLSIGEQVTLNEAGYDRYLAGHGFHRPGAGAVWTELPVVDMVMRMPVGVRSIELGVVGANTSSSLPAQYVEVEVDGSPVRDWLLKGGEVMSIPVPDVVSSKGGLVRLTLRLPDTAQRSVVVPGNPDTRALGIAIATVKASEGEAAIVFQRPFEAEVRLPHGRLGMLGRGWGSPSGSGRRWSVGKQAIVRWKNDPHRVVRVLVLIYDRVYTGPGGEPQRIRATQGAATVGEWVVDKPGELIIPIPSEGAAASRWTEVQFSFPDAQSPASRGESGDTRELAIQITGIELR